MMRKTDMKGFEEESSWIQINRGFISISTLQEWIKEYFGKDENLSNFRRRNEGWLELMSPDYSRGYSFWGELQLDRDVKGRMERDKKYNMFGKIILREFVDYEQGVAGFSWRRS